jgi:hypothetical protein
MTSQLRRTAQGRLFTGGHRLQDSASLTERVISTAAATIVTLGLAFLVLSVPRPIIGITPFTAKPQSRDAERVIYAAASRPMPAALPSRPVTSKSAPTEAHQNTESRVHAPAVAAYRDGVLPDTGKEAPLAASAGTLPVPTSGTAASRGAAVRFSPPSPPGSTHPDSALIGIRSDLGALLSDGSGTSLSQEDRDVQHRAAALKAILARAAGLPTPPSGGGGIPVGLPLGGPSRAQRERDRAIHGENMAIMERIQRRADSLTAARRQRLADSLARLEDPLRPSTRPRI